MVCQNIAKLPGNRPLSIARHRVLRRQLLLPRIQSWRCNLDAHRGRCDRQLGITISPNVKSTFFLLFLFAVGYGVGPQFVRGIAKDGTPQALFAVIVCIFCLFAPLLAAKLAGYDMGYTAGLYAGSQTISASMGLATDAINRLGRPAEETKALLDAMPVAYAVTYIFGTVGSAVILAQLGPKLLGIDLVAACRDYEKSHGWREPSAARVRFGVDGSCALSGCGRELG